MMRDKRRTRMGCACDGTLNSVSDLVGPIETSVEISINQKTALYLGVSVAIGVLIGATVSTLISKNL